MTAVVEHAFAAACWPVLSWSCLSDLYHVVLLFVQVTPVSIGDNAPENGGQDVMNKPRLRAFAWLIAARHTTTSAAEHSNVHSKYASLVLAGSFDQLF